LRDGVELHASSVTRVEDAVVAFGGGPKRLPRCKQRRMLGSIALELVDVAAGGVAAGGDGRPLPAPRGCLGGVVVLSGAGRRDRRRSGGGARPRRPSCAPPGRRSRNRRARRRADRRPVVSSIDLEAMRTAAEKAAKAGGVIVREHLGRLREVRAKAPGDWV